MARELLARGEARWVSDACERAAAGGAGISGESIVRALGHAQLGQENALVSLEDELLRVEDAPVFAPAIAAILRRLLAAGRASEAERMQDLLARLAGRSPAWRITASSVLGEIGQLDDALGLTAVPIADAAWEEERRLLRRRLELQACAAHPAVREAIGELAGREGPIDSEEAATMARELATIVDRDDSQVVSPGLAVIAAILETRAHGLGFASLASALGRLSDDLDTEEAFAAPGGSGAPGA